MIDLCAAVFGWAEFRAAKSLVKLHVVLDHDDRLPGYADYDWFFSS